jgi:hypothetical protein
MPYLIRNILLAIGVIAGGLLAFAGFVREVEAPEQAEQPAPADPVKLRTARPPRQTHVPVGNPASLDGAFGRSEITGVQTRSVPLDPLHSLAFERRWDAVLDAPPVDPATGLNVPRAADEVLEPEISEALPQAEPLLRTLTGEARMRAEEGLASMHRGTELLKEGMQQFRRPGQAGLDGRQKIRDAADLLRDARDKFDAALRLAPDNRALWRVIQETKANLYAAMKHGR